MVISLPSLLLVNVYILSSSAVSKNSAVKLSYNSSYAHMLQSL